MTSFYAETEDSDDDDTPKMRCWKPSDKLSPRPPHGWLMAYYLGTNAEHPVDIGCWLYVLASAQLAAKARGCKLHTVVRDSHAIRILLVDPAIKAEIDEALEVVHFAMESEPDCVEPDMQEAAAKVIAQRKWARLSMAEKIDLLDSNVGEDADLGLAFASIDKIGSLALAFDVTYNT